MMTSTKFEVDMTIHRRATALLMRTLGDLDPWPWTLVIHGGSRDQPFHKVWRSYAYPFL